MQHCSSQPCASDAWHVFLRKQATMTSLRGLASSAVSVDASCAMYRREFWSCFALHDQKEGMSAFLEKREPHFQDR